MAKSLMKKSYWNNNGKHQVDYDRLFALLVPEAGECPTTAGELLRGVSNLYYDLYNNGLCNLDTPHMKLMWMNIVRCKDEIVKLMGRNGEEAFGNVALSFSSHLRRLRHGEGGMYVTDDFPYRDMEKVVDACVVLVKKRAGASPNLSKTPIEA